MPGVPRDVVSVVERAAEGAFWFYSYRSYKAHTRTCLRRDRYKRVREAIRPVRRWLNRIHHNSDMNHKLVCVGSYTSG